MARRQRPADNPWNADQDPTDEQLEPPIHEEKGFGNIIVVDNIPVITKEKYDKLKAILLKIFNTAAPSVRELIFPQDASGSTKGYAFVEYPSVEHAQTAIEKTNGYKLDKSHIFKVQSYEDFDKYLNTPETYTAPETPKYVERENLRSWLLDERGIDQYAVRYGEITEVLWNDLKEGEEPESVVKRDHWTESYVSWSPLGTYLATIHHEGVALWGGPNWVKLGRFPHPGVKLIDFSPCERYLVTASPQFAENDNPKDPQCIIVWDIRTGSKMRGFTGQGLTAPTAPTTATSQQWPVFKWSHDDKYLARMSEDMISVYETPSMDLLDKKSITISGLKDFSWSPSEHVISYFVPESDNKPSSVSLIDIPSRKERRAKNLFNVSDCKMYWQSAGDYLCVKVDRTAKTKKISTDFEVFRMKEKGVPIEHFELKENILSFSWEPKGNRFAIIHGEMPRPDISFYSTDGGKLKLLKTLEKKAANSLYWSPAGGFIVLAGLHNLNGALEFYNVNDLESMGTEEHFMASSVEWDPTGRYVVSVVSYWKHQLENGYNLYSFSGRLLKRTLRDKFYQLSWRPRPPSLLTPERLQHIKKNIRDYSKELKNEDKKKKEEERQKKRAKRAALRKEFEDILSERNDEYDQDKDIRRRLRHGEDSDDERDYEKREEWVEDVEQVQEIVINEQD